MKLYTCDDLEFVQWDDEAGTVSLRLSCSGDTFLECYATAVIDRFTDKDEILSTVSVHKLDTKHHELVAETIEQIMKEVDNGTHIKNNR